LGSTIAERRGCSGPLSLALSGVWSRSLITCLAAPSSSEPKDGATLDFFLSERRSAKAAKRFLGAALKRSRDWDSAGDQHRQKPSLWRGDRGPEEGATVLRDKGRNGG
jgi:hypothetical protein